MPSVTQPVGMKNDSGVILNVGIFSCGQPSAIVLPLVCEPDPASPNNLCLDAVASYLVSCIAQTQALLSTESYITHISAEGMVDGKVPFRQDFGPTDFPGTFGSGTIPNQVAALAVFYEEAADYVPNPTPPPISRIRVAKNFIPGIAPSAVVQDSLTAGMKTAMNVWISLVQNGFPSSDFVSAIWYRVLATPKPRLAGTTVKRSGQCEARGYVATQRRRLTPRV